MNLRPRLPYDGPPAIVLNASLSGLGAIRSLGRAGVRVVAMDPDPTRLGFTSRYAESRPGPHPVREPEAAVATLLAEADRLDAAATGPATRRPVLSPASDAYVLLLSRHREALAPRFRLILPPVTAVERGLDKRGLYEMAARHGVAHADTHYPENPADVVALAHHLSYPVYLKPYESHRWALAFPGAGKGVVAEDASQLVDAFTRAHAAGIRVMVQAIIVGPVTNIRSVRAYIDADGQVRAAVTNRKLRQYPTMFGRATLAETTDDPEVRALGLGLLQAIGFRGFGLLEFKRDDRDGRLKLTDLNPRWLKSVNLATAAGVDFPLIHYRDLAGDPLPTLPLDPVPYRVGSRWWEAAGDIAAARQLIGAGELTTAAWLRSLAGVRGFASLAVDDPRPFLHEYGYGRRLLRRPIRRPRQ
ncbi:MAG TPA: hypothetical protein VGT61_09860 [Thermomicrobiales bacterium]|jgi:predicted ATP-grasp superfamily ATP-dependent carboligase|nr:hypothetical protein [Thermomicrobiales bacterium]